MGSATTQARTTVTAALDAAPVVPLDVARELFAAARAIGGSSHLGAALADAAAPSAARAQVVTDVFGSVLHPTAVQLLTVVVAQRWSSPADLIEGINETAIRAASIAVPDADIEEELFRFSRTVAENSELELALGARRGDSTAKGTLVDTLLGGRASEATTLIVASIVRQTGDRRVRQLLSWAMKIVADQRDRKVATVVSAAPLSAVQIDRLSSALAKKYGTRVSLNAVIDPAVVGGLRVQIADDVIDASVSSRLADLRQRLAG